MSFRVIYKQQNTPGNPGVYIYVNPKNIEFSGRGHILGKLDRHRREMINKAREGLLTHIFTLVDNFVSAYKNSPDSSEFNIEGEKAILIEKLKIFLYNAGIIVIDKYFHEWLHDKFMTLIAKADDTYSGIIYDLEYDIVNLLYAYSHSLKNQEGGFRKRSTQRKRTPRTRKVVQTRKKRY